MSVVSKIGGGGDGGRGLLYPASTLFECRHIYRKTRKVCRFCRNEKGGGKRRLGVPFAAPPNSANTLVDPAKCVRVFTSGRARERVSGHTAGHTSPTGAARFVGRHALELWGICVCIYGCVNGEGGARGRQRKECESHFSSRNPSVVSSPHILSPTTHTLPHSSTCQESGAGGAHGRRDQPIRCTGARSATSAADHFVQLYLPPPLSCQGWKRVAVILVWARSMHTQRGGEGFGAKPVRRQV